jgi:hypothetical protein
MPKYQFNGDHQSITIEGVTFIKGEATELAADQAKLLEASGFWKPLLENGEIVELKDEPKPAAKPANKATTAAAGSAKAE